MDSFQISEAAGVVIFVIIACTSRNAWRKKHNSPTKPFSWFWIIMFVWLIGSTFPRSSGGSFHNGLGAFAGCATLVFFYLREKHKISG